MQKKIRDVKVTKLVEILIIVVVVVLVIGPLNRQGTFVDTKRENRSLS